MMRSLIGFVVLLAFVASVNSYAQSVFNPDLSVIPRFSFTTDDGSLLPGKREFSQPEFSLEEIEFALQAYVNPYARADIFISMAGIEEPEIEIEEAYATFLKGLPLDMNIRLGKYLVEFGKFNQLHPHAWPFVTGPLSRERFLGDEGLNDLGVSASFLLPTGDLYSRISFDLLRGTSIAKLSASDNVAFGAPGLSDSTGGRVYYANSARLMSFLPLSENSDLEVGISGLTGIHDPYAKLRFYYANLDLKYKWRPSDYTSLTIIGEGLFNSRDIQKNPGGPDPVATEELSTSGFFLYSEFRFEKVFSVAGRVDWSESPYSGSDRAGGFAFVVGYYPVEESAAIRLQYQNTTTVSSGGSEMTVNSIGLQFIFSLGPHKAHPF